MQLAEQQPFLDTGRQIQEIQDLGHPGSTHAQLPGRIGIAGDRTLLDQPLDVVGQGQHPGGAVTGRVLGF